MYLCYKLKMLFPRKWEYVSSATHWAACTCSVFSDIKETFSNELKMSDTVNKYTWQDVLISYSSANVEIQNKQSSNLKLDIFLLFLAHSSDPPRFSDYTVFILTVRLNNCC